MTSDPFEIQESVILAAPAAAVWDALVTRNGLKRWLGAQLFVIAIDDSGQIEIPILRDGKTINVVGETSLINAPQQLIFTWIEQDEYGMEWDFPTVVSLALEPHNGGTRLTLTHKGLKRLPLETRQEILAQYRDFWQEKMTSSLLEAA